MRDTITLELDSGLLARLDETALNRGSNLDEVVNDFLRQALDDTGRISTSALAKRFGVGNTTILRNWREWKLERVGTVARGEFEFSMRSVVKFEESFK